MCSFHKNSFLLFMIRAAPSHLIFYRLVLLKRFSINQPIKVSAEEKTVLVDVKQHCASYIKQNAPKFCISNKLKSHRCEKTRICAINIIK